jgi:hypothetical protein
MAFSHRKEFARWVAEAKQEETRQRRVRQAVEMIRGGPDSQLAQLPAAAARDQVEGHRCGTG